MITRIELTNFMSHTRTVLEPAAGLTVMVGPNNCGKSAVVTALEILCHNESSTYVMRHGEKECSVEVRTDDGHTVRWTRKGSPSYLIDGQAFDRLRNAGVPEQLHQALRLPKVEAGDDLSFDIHFGCQKSPIFLLDSPGSAAAKFFGASSDASRLLEMQKRHREKLKARQGEKTRLEVESAQLNKELSALQPAGAIELKLNDAERMQAELTQIACGIAEAERDSAALEGQWTAVSHHQSECRALKPLAAPPELHDVRMLEQLMNGINERQGTIRRLETRRGILSPLSPVPALAETGALESLVERLQDSKQVVLAEEKKSEVLRNVPVTPIFEDVTALTLLVNKLMDAEAGRIFSAAKLAAASGLAAIEAPAATEAIEKLTADLDLAAARVDELKREVADVGRQLTGAATELRELARDATCPTCGAALDAERLLAAGGGGHAHE